MINNKIENVTIITAEVTTNGRMFRSARRRSLSGSAVPSSGLKRHMNLGFKTDKWKFRHHFIQDKDYDCENQVHSDTENTVKSIDSLSCSSGINVSDLCQKSNSSALLSGHRRKCHSISAKTKIKHFLAEHIAGTNRCQHPEYHFNKKNYDNRSEFQDDSSHGSFDTSSSKEKLNSKQKVDLELSNPLPTTSSILNRIRLINIQPYNPRNKTNDDTPAEYNSNRTTEHHACSTGSFESQNDFPFPEPNPCKLPRVLSPSSIDFSPKLILTSKRKHKKMAHSTSYDPDYLLSDICKFFPEKDKWEKKISGYLDTSTSTGATLTAINFGLKRVTETDKYLMITKSPISSPNEFLEDGISHIEDTSSIFQSLMRHLTCHDVMPDSGKVIIIDSQMQIGRAFEAIEDNIVRASPIWSSEKQDFIALLTVNDLVPLLLHIHQQNIDTDPCYEDDVLIHDFSAISVEKCLSVIPRFRTLQNRIVGVTPETNLRAVTILFNQFKKSILLVIDSYLSGNPLFLISDLRMLTYLFFKAQTISLESCLSTKIGSTTIMDDQQFQMLTPLVNDLSHVSMPGKRQYMIHESSSVLDVLRTMAQSSLCCALIVDEDVLKDDTNTGKYIIKDVITMADILNLIKIQKHRDITVTANHILQYRHQYYEEMTYRDPVIGCCIDDSVHHLIQVIVQEKASFVLLRATSDNQSVTLRILTAKDVLSYIDSLPYNSIAPRNKNHFNYLDNSMRSHSGNCDINEHVSTIPDDSLEEIFDI